MTTPAWIENDELARRQMELGWEWQRYVADFFKGRGFVVDLPEFSWRESAAQIINYSDTRDLTVAGHRVEVKSRALSFTDDPSTFPHDRAIVDTVSSYEAYKIKPIAYVFVSQTTKSMLWTPASDRDSVRWRVDTLRDSVRKIVDKFYQVRRDELRPIVDLVELLSIPTTSGIH